MKTINNEKYLEDLNFYSQVDFIDYDRLRNKTILITGATGLIGRYFIDLIMFLNRNKELNCKIVGMSKNKEKALNIFSNYFDNENFDYIFQDVTKDIEYSNNIDYIIHCASNTSPSQYTSNPVETISTNVLGTLNLLKLSLNKNVSKFLFVSSFEVYGKVSNSDKISENDYGIIDNTLLRSCYPESKRLSESLCISYSEEYNVDTSILRLSRVFGPTMNYESTLSLSQFIKSALNLEDIILKSDGLQRYSYNYVGDVVTAIIKVMLNGSKGEAYNVADEKYDDTLKNFAEMVANCVGKKVIFETATLDEKKGFSNSTMTILDSEKIKKLGWNAEKNLNVRIKDTIDILK